MIKIKRKNYIALLGLLWLFLGACWSFWGTIVILHSALDSNFNSFSNGFVKILARIIQGYELAAVIIICLGIVLGYFFSKHFLANSVRKILYKFYQYPYFLNLFKLYNFHYWGIVFIYLFLSLYLSYLGISRDIRGIMNLIVGIAFINSSLLYFVFFFKKN